MAQHASVNCRRQWPLIDAAVGSVAEDRFHHLTSVKCMNAHNCNDKGIRRCCQHSSLVEWICDKVRDRELGLRPGLYAGHVPDDSAATVVLHKWTFHLFNFTCSPVSHTCLVDDVRQRWISTVVASIADDDSGSIGHALQQTLHWTVWNSYRWTATSSQYTAIGRNVISTKTASQWTYHNNTKIKAPLYPRQIQRCL